MEASVRSIEDNYGTANLQCHLSTLVEDPLRILEDGVQVFRAESLEICYRRTEPILHICFLLAEPTMRLGGIEQT